MSETFLKAVPYQEVNLEIAPLALVKLSLVI